MRGKHFYYLAILIFLIFLDQSKGQKANHLVIAEIYCDGGSTDAIYINDYVVLYNPTSFAINLDAWSLQYSPPTSYSYESNIVNLLGLISAEGYYLIKFGSSGSVGSELPITEMVSSSINLNGTSGKIALVNNQDAITEMGDNNVVDFLGYGGSPGPTEYEGTAKGQYPTSKTKSLCRKDNSGETTYGTNGSGWDTNDNSADFFQNVSPLPLPVELTYFTAEYKNDIILLNWSTATEINNFGFSVERKAENSNWEAIGFVKGSGNCNSPKTYSFCDSTPRAGKVQYRLKQIDNDGSYKFYYASEVEVNVDGYELKQNYPNPFNPLTHISFSLPVKSNVKLVVFDLLGREIVVLVNSQAEAGIYNVEFDGSKLSSGIYYYALITNGFIQAKKLVLLK